MNVTSTTQKIILAAAFGLFGIVPSWGEATLAQSTPSPDSPESPVLPTPTNTPERDNSNREGVSGERRLGGSLNPFDLIHNSNLSRTRSLGEFAEDTEKNINSAAEEFKRLRLQQLQEQPGEFSPDAAPEN